MGYREILHRIFFTHENFYEVFRQVFPQRTKNITNWEKYHPSHSTFTSECDGWVLFVKDMRLAPQDIGAILEYVLKESLQYKGKDYVSEILAEISQGVSILISNYMKKLEETICEHRTSDLVKMFIEAVQIINDGWSFDGRYFIYRKRIDVMCIRKKGEIIAIPFEEVGKLYCEGLMVDIRENINGLSSVYAANAFHPNIKSENQNVCLGEMKGIPLMEGLRVLPNSLVICNLDSAYDNDATKYAESLVKKLTREVKNE